ncbi:MAG: DNA repair protein RadC [Parasphingorhabdus sp.]|jgi:DNA repair protein RadC
MSIKDWPESERPREKFLKQGPQALSDAELICLFLRTGTSRNTAMDVARTLLKQFGGLRKLLSASAEELTRTHGVGTAKYVQLIAARELGARYLAEQLKERTSLESPQDASDYLTLRMRDLPHEVFAAVFLDNRHRVLHFEELFSGTINGASVHPREVVKRALSLNAAAMIVAHNHPSGISEPSQADISITGRLRDALALVEVRLLDHLIVGEGGCVSLSERGVI